MTIRIWHQSVTDLTRLTRYRDALHRHARVACRDDVRVDVHGVAPNTYPEGVPPIETTCYPWMSSLLSTQIVHNAIRAEQEDYNAVAISCFLDPGLREARASVDIPVVSILETSLLATRAVAGSVGLVGLGGAMASDMLRLADNYGLTERIAAVVPVTPPITELELDDLSSSSEVVDRVTRAARATVKAGAELIVPAEGVLNTVLVGLGVTEIDNVPVLDAYGLLLNQAVMFADLWLRTGLRTSRSGVYAKPPDFLRRHVTAATAEVFRNIDDALDGRE